MDTTDRERLVEVEQRSKSNTYRIDKLEKNYEVLQSIATSVQIIATKQDYMAEKVESLDTKVDGIEKIPANRWKLIVDNIISGIVGAIVVAVVAAIAFFAK